MKMKLILLISYGRSDKNNPINNSRCRTKLCPTTFTNYGLHFYLRIDQMVRKDMKGMGMQFNFENDLQSWSDKSQRFFFLDKIIDNSFAMFFGEKKIRNIVVTSKQIQSY